MSAPIVIELEPAGPGPALRERFASAVAAAAPNARLEVRGLIVAVIPVADGRDDGVKLRKAHKTIGREALLRAHWTARAGRPPPKTPRKRKVAPRCRTEPARAIGRGARQPERTEP